jgi:mRNA interferase MazF
MVSRPIAVRFDVYLVRLDPTIGAEMRKTRPCVIISPQEMNRTVLTVIIAPMTSTTARFPWRVPCRFAGRSGEIALDQLRSVDILRLGKRLGQLDKATSIVLTDALLEHFA